MFSKNICLALFLIFSMTVESLHSYNLLITVSHSIVFFYWLTFQPHGLTYSMYIVDAMKVVQKCYIYLSHLNVAVLKALILLHITFIKRSLLSQVLTSIDFFQIPSNARPPDSFIVWFNFPHFLPRYDSTLLSSLACLIQCQDKVGPKA